MIPKRAFYFWEGGEMPWLCKKSVESFSSHNPDWTVERVDGSWLGEGNGRRLNIVHRSDCTRYRELSRSGGLYFDTDIVFVGPVPDDYIARDYIVPVSPTGAIGHVAFLGSKVGGEFFALMEDVTSSLLRNGGPIGYQQLGLELLNKYRHAIAGQDTALVPTSFIIPCGWTEVERLWKEQAVPLPKGTIGVHWFGGDPLTQDLMPTLNEKWAAESNCLVAKALRGQA